MTPTDGATKVVYKKPWTSYEQQMDLLATRGLVINDRASATRVLASIGYYRLGAYVYPFRELLPESERQKQSPTHFRSDTIAAGTTFEDVETVWRFDRNLRHAVLDAVETIEVGLKSRIAYVLGRRDRFGHLDPLHLDTEAVTNRQFWKQKRFDETQHERWLFKYDENIERAQEDYVAHNLHKYVDLPVWIGLEPASFGQMVDLFWMLKREDQHEIAVSLGLKNGAMMGNWLAALRYLRNEAAHHCRIWNRERSFQMQRPKAPQVGPELEHVVALPASKKIYSTLAVAAYLVRNIDPKSNFHNSVKTRVTKFERDSSFSAGESMGFPENWNTLALWR